MLLSGYHKLPVESTGCKLFLFKSLQNPVYSRSEFLFNFGGIKHMIIGKLIAPFEKFYGSFQKFSVNEDVFPHSPEVFA